MKTFRQGSSHSSRTDKRAFNGGVAPVRLTMAHTVIQRYRWLPGKGKVLVRVGQTVDSDTPIGEWFNRSGFLQLDLSRGLGVPASRLEEFILAPLGSWVQQGDVLVGPVGIAHRVVRSPVMGRVIALINGEMILEVPGESSLIQAGYPGEVVEVIGDHCVVIETHGSVIRGAWGNGKMSDGEIEILMRTPDHILAQEDLSVSLRQKLVCAGYCKDENLLKLAESIKVKGLILSSLDPDMLSHATLLTFPLMILEGFGRYHVSDEVFQLLQTINHSSAFLNAQAWNPSIDDKPELVIPLPRTEPGQHSTVSGMLLKGVKVRITAAPYLGLVGVIHEFLGVMKFPGGIRIEAVEIQIMSGKYVVVPLTNLEIIRINAT